jgi:hypothetical protein
LEGEINMLTAKGEAIMYGFLQNMSGTVLDVCWKNSKLTEEEKNAFTLNKAPG